jgi:hypothetical protein
MLTPRPLRGIPGVDILGYTIALADTPVEGLTSSDVQSTAVVGASNNGVGVAGYSVGPPGIGPDLFLGQGVTDGVLGVGLNGVHGESNSNGNGVLGYSASSNAW